MTRKDKLALGAFLGWKGYTVEEVSTGVVTRTVRAVLRDEYLDAWVDGTFGAANDWYDDKECLVFVELYLQQLAGEPPSVTAEGWRGT